jgi:hypothetical protein
MDSSRKAVSPDYRGFYRAVAGCGNSTLGRGAKRAQAILAN